MSARDEAVEMIRRICPAHLSADEYGQILAEKFDAHRAEVLAEAKVEVVAWLVKKDRENTPVGELASKVDRGAVRIFLGTGHYHDAMDAHRAEVLREAAALLEDRACDADWAQPRDYIAGLREGAELLLANTGEEATAEAATATPDFFQPGHSYTHRNGVEDFHCVAVTAHPQTGERLAMGWRVDSWALHYPAAVGINQWRHEYDGVQSPTSTEAGESA
jgi:hypothetical protein